ncbi:MAG: hypothetical protein AMXMBFR13_47850 [Phycisphaerae bacterium]
MIAITCGRQQPAELLPQQNNDHQQAEDTEDDAFPNSTYTPAPMAEKPQVRLIASDLFRKRPQPYISLLERGLRNPSLSVITQLADALKTPPSRLVADFDAERRT